MPLSRQIRAPPEVENAPGPKRKELSPYMSGMIAGAAAAAPGVSIAQIARRFNLPHSTVRGTIRLDSARNDGQSRARTGRPKSYTDRDVRNLIRHVQLHPTDTYAQTREALSTPHSARIIKEILKANGIIHHRVSKVQKVDMQKTIPGNPRGGRKETI